MFYEATLLISPRVSNEDIFSVWESISKEIQKLGSIVKKESKPLERGLAYPIKKDSSFRRAYLGTFYLEPASEPGAFAQALRDCLKTNHSILRFMVSRIKEIPETLRKAAPAKISAPEKIAQESKDDKPPLADLDKKLEEILEDKIAF